MNCFLRIALVALSEGKVFSLTVKCWIVNVSVVGAFCENVCGVALTP
jgi:hypothetical protein